MLIGHLLGIVFVLCLSVAPAKTLWTLLRALILIYGLGLAS